MPNGVTGVVMSFCHQQEAKQRQEFEAQLEDCRQRRKAAILMANQIIRENTINKITYTVYPNKSTTTFQCHNCKGHWQIINWRPNAVEMFCPYCGILARPEET